MAKRDNMELFVKHSFYEVFNQKWAFDG